MQRKVAFLDRDGVVNQDIGYLHNIQQCEFCLDVFLGANKLNKIGFDLVVVSNQSGLARGYFDLSQYEDLTQWIHEQFTKKGAPLLASYYCPHHPSAGNHPVYTKSCDCRKPKAGMLLQAKQEYDIDFSESIMIGDSERDIEAGLIAGVDQTFLISSKPKIQTKANAVFRSLDEVADHMISINII